MAEGDSDFAGRWTLGFSLSGRDVKRLERACAAMDVDQESFLRFCVIRGITEAEAKAREAHTRKPVKQEPDVKWLESLYKLRDSRPVEKRGR
ncbi:MAG TPA: hypothetical protein VFB14_24150 [Bryobacteraceae bacterium]|jgi:hypothetical protein|nr:hypothetical protein [Bryobacteraceae bacterium]